MGILSYCEEIKRMKTEAEIQELLDNIEANRIDFNYEGAWRELDAQIEVLDWILS